MSLTTYIPDLLASLSSTNLVPSSLIPAQFVPTVKINVKYGNKEATRGTTLRTNETRREPIVIIENTEPGKTYTLLLLDPDAPTPEDPKFAYWRHWIVTGLTEAVTPPALTEYLGPGAKDASASPHRYLFLLLQEPEGFAVTKKDVGGEEFVERRSFRAVEWVARNGLVLVGVEWFSGVGDVQQE